MKSLAAILVDLTLRRYIKGAAGRQVIVDADDLLGKADVGAREFDTFESRHLDKFDRVLVLHGNIRRVAEETHDLFARGQAADLAVHGRRDLDEVLAIGGKEPQMALDN